MVIDPDHSVARFSIRHFMIANVEGLFTRMTGVIQFDPPDLTPLSVDAEIDVKSLTAGHQERDEHLLSPDYFDAENYPNIVFQSTRDTLGESSCGPGRIPVGPNPERVLSQNLQEVGHSVKEVCDVGIVNGHLNPLVLIEFSNLDPSAFQNSTG